MHFAGPPRKSSHPPPYALRSSRTVIWRRYPLTPRLIVLVSLVALSALFVLFRLFSGGLGEPEAFTQAPKGHPNVVLVTTIDKGMSTFVTESIKKNREAYAERHGYATFFPEVTDYELLESPKSWAKVPAIRHAMTRFPKTPYFFFLDHHTLIMNHELSVEKHIMNRARLESLMLVDVPIIPPDSVIRTFQHVAGDRVDLVLAQDKDGLLPNSMILRRSEWSKYFLDAWFDPLYRTYNFQKAEKHALEHIVQWHGTLLAKLALVPQNIMSSYTAKEAHLAGENGLYKEGDFIVYLGNCERSDRSCEAEMRPYLAKIHPSTSQS